MVAANDPTHADWGLVSQTLKDMADQAMTLDILRPQSYLGDVGMTQPVPHPD
jgi:hypothetical protein